jgi:hypothetical protein
MMTYLLVRYALGIDLPDFVAEDPVIEALNQYANDLVTWSNVSNDPLYVQVEFNQ